MDIKNISIENISIENKSVLRSIVNSDGDCVNASWCLTCPFIDECVSKAIVGGRLLPKERRVELAYNLLFHDAIEEELGENEIQ